MRTIYGFAWGKVSSTNYVFACKFKCKQLPRQQKNREGVFPKKAGFLTSMDK